MPQRARGHSQFAQRSPLKTCGFCDYASCLVCITCNQRAGRYCRSTLLGEGERCQGAANVVSGTPELLNKVTTVYEPSVPIATSVFIGLQDYYELALQQARKLAEALAYTSQTKTRSRFPETYPRRHAARIDRILIALGASFTI